MRTQAFLMSWASSARLRYFLTIASVCSGLFPGTAGASSPSVAVSPSENAKVCVLNYERAAHPMTRELMNIFDSDLNAYIFTEAVPTDLMNCLTGDYREIILVAHAVQDPKNNNPVSLGYFTRYTDAEKQALLAQGAKLPNQTLYHLESFLPQIFRAIHTELEAKKARGEPITVKRIRWMSCLPDQVFNVYPEFKQILDEFGIGLDVAPKQVLMSVIKGETVTGFDRLWLAESAQSEDAPTPNAWFYSYIDLKTLGVQETGDAVSLHGKYKIHFHGTAIGLASRWTELYIRYGDLDGMKIGETRTIKGPRLDISAGLGEDFELDILPRLDVEAPSDFNSGGISFGFWSDIDVERMY